MDHACGCRAQVRFVARETNMTAAFNTLEGRMLRSIILGFTCLVVLTGGNAHAWDWRLGNQPTIPTCVFLEWRYPPPRNLDSSLCVQHTACKQRYWIDSVCTRWVYLPKTIPIPFPNIPVPFPGR